jgi:hypothetical protein
MDRPGSSGMIPPVTTANEPSYADANSPVQKCFQSSTKDNILEKRKNTGFHKKSGVFLA